MAERLLKGPWSMEVKPERGGRVTSLRLHGDELLDQGIGVDEPVAEDFVAGGACGWDEMVPTVERCLYPGPGAWTGRELPDHGEAWRLKWSVLARSAEAVVMECRGVALPWRLERKIEIGDHAVHVAYAYLNCGQEPLYAYWCAHPLFRYEPGMAVDGVEKFIPEGTSAKLHLPPGSSSSAVLAWRSGSAIEIAWDSSLTPYVGVWACNGDLGGYRQIAIEPASGGNDHPDSEAPPPLLQPGEELRWWLEIRDRRRLRVGE